MTSPTSRAAGAALAALLVVGAGACGSSGRELRDYPTGQTAPARNAPAAGTLEDGSTTVTSNVFSLATDEWTPGGPLPVKFTCDGEDISPALSISATPEGTAEIALVVSDLDRDGLVHWVVAGIAPDTTTIAEGSVPEGAVQTQTIDGRVGYVGPCPPVGETHTYAFDLYALESPSGVTEGQDGAAAVAAIEAATMSQSTLTATSRR